jgi:hypothetical protein
LTTLFKNRPNIDINSLLRNSKILYDSDTCIPFIASNILPIAAFSFADSSQGRDSLDSGYIFGMLIAQLTLDPEP